jgi:hypothetical protein
LHFDIIITSRDEGGHAVLKRKLESSSEDLKTMIDSVNLLLINQHHDYLLSLKEQKVRYSLDLRKKIFQQLVSHISHYALRKISVQYDLLTERSIAIESCTNRLAVG